VFACESARTRKEEVILLARRKSESEPVRERESESDWREVM
jgi:hypothetical protein